MHDFAEALFQVLLEVLGVFFGEKARNRGCAWAAMWCLIVGAVVWIVLAVLGS
jgi:hypothetical protein